MLNFGAPGVHRLAAAVTVALIVALLFGTTNRDLFGQSPCGCGIAQLGNGWTLHNVNNGNINVCFQPDKFTPEEQAGLLAGLAYVRSEHHNVDL